MRARDGKPQPRTSRHLHRRRRRGTAAATRTLRHRARSPCPVGPPGPRRRAPPVDRAAGTRRNVVLIEGRWNTGAGIVAHDARGLGRSATRPKCAATTTTASGDVPSTTSVISCSAGADTNTSRPSTDRRDSASASNGRAHALLRLGDNDATRGRGSGTKRAGEQLRLVLLALVVQVPHCGLGVGVAHPSLDLHDAGPVDRQ
jgi:hypothetical protein